MLSIIVCSISPELLSKLAQSIEETIGVEYELIAIDNRQDNRPIAQVYNEGARKARYPYLFFVHEDVLFHSKDWGAIIERKLAEPDCGVVGFAGCKAMMNTYGGWAQYDNQWLCAFYFANISGRPTWLESYNVKLHTPYEQVVTLDGFAFFVRRDVWAEFPFDEDENFQFRKKLTRINKMLSYYTFYRCSNNFIKRAIKWCISRVFVFINGGFKRTNRMYDKLCQKYDSLQNSFYYDYLSYKPYRVLKIPYNTFNKTVDHCFENTTIKIPEDFRNALLPEYGDDYLIRKKAPNGHGNVYIDLENSYVKYEKLSRKEFYSLFNK